MPTQTAFLRHAAKVVAALIVMAGFAASALASEKNVKFNLASGASTTPIVCPAFNTPISLTGAQTAIGFRAVGQATLLCVKDPNPNASFLEWVGFDYFTAAITKGFTSAFGTHIIYLDFAGRVDVEVSDASHIIVHNIGGIGVATGVVTLVW